MKKELLTGQSPRSKGWTVLNAAHNEVALIDFPQLVVEDIVGKDALVAARDESAVTRPQKERAPGRGHKATKRTGNIGSSNGAKRAKNMGLTRETTISPTMDVDMRMSRKTKSVVLDYADICGKD